jgi:hypothetical protein
VTKKEKIKLIIAGLIIVIAITAAILHHRSIQKKMDEIPFTDTVMNQPLPITIPVIEDKEIHEKDYFTVISNRCYVSGGIRIVVVEDKQSLIRYAIVVDRDGIAIIQLKEKCW